MSKKSKFFRVAVAGATTDGRVIEPEWIQQMAKNYNLSVYTSQGNIEHIRSVLPDSPFGNYAKILALKAQEDMIGDQKKWALYAQCEAYENLLELHKKNQKLYCSIEVNPSFADTNEAYLMGLAFTDTPASLGTQVMEFASKNPEANPFINKKQQKDNLFTASQEIDLQFEEESSVANLFSSVMEWLNPKQQEQDNKNNSQFREVAKSVEKIAETFGSTLQDLNDLKNKHTKLQNDFNELKSKLGGEHHSQTPPAPESTGNYSEKIEC
ncbi:capsid scaffolding protein serine peptidase [Acinetobacter sp. WC-323]|uniref:GPO family capsid scaffolding protein n=1 Tax=Acinetobacter sp. WC-323 TaxID=903918 RepID=UPI00029E7002|nr:GPO family capsid scaffolding protein [Acinetobacter sp. WC-323]EKU54499.1 capsid scaffolding protein serine peptidase [Acinetobacter sp. WC-323]HAV5431535.1 capsid protein [Acinetobacter baumannii]